MILMIITNVKMAATLPAGTKYIAINSTASSAIDSLKPFTLSMFLNMNGDSMAPTTPEASVVVSNKLPRSARPIMLLT
ncbi:Uncharacterised protein [Klebsiella pneumoniae]|nr:Uncharacterised protein [Klebsiella pneumoniae]